MKGFWRPVFELNNPQPYQVLILVKACEANDRAEQARRVLKKEGLTFLDRFEKPKPRPEIAIELTNKTLFVALLRQIHLHNEYWEYIDD